MGEAFSDLLLVLSGYSSGAGVVGAAVGIGIGVFYAGDSGDETGLIIALVGAVVGYVVFYLIARFLFEAVVPIAITTTARYTRLERVGPIVLVPFAGLVILAEPVGTAGGLLLSYIVMIGTAVGIEYLTGGFDDASRRRLLATAAVVSGAIALRLAINPPGGSATAHTLSPWVT